MPIPLTKYSKISALHQDLSTNSYIYNQYILTCDISDTQYLDNGTVRSNKSYINNKADYLIHPFSTVTNCVTKFNNEKPIYQYKKPIVPEITGDTDYDISATQKIIQNTVVLTNLAAEQPLYNLELPQDHENHEYGEPGGLSGTDISFNPGVTGTLTTILEEDDTIYNPIYFVFWLHEIVWKIRFGSLKIE